MEKLTYRFTLDTHKPGIQRVLQGFETADSLARAIEVTLTEGSESFNFTNNITAMLYIKGIDIPRACEIEDGIISYTFQNADITEEGTHECQIKIIETSIKGAKRVIASPRFEVEAWESHVSDVPAEATDAFTALEMTTAKAVAAYDARITLFEFDENFVLTVKYGVNEDGTQVVYTSDVFKNAIERIQPTITIGNVYDSNEVKVVNRGTVTDLILDFYLKRGERGFTGMTGPKGDTGAQGPTGRTATVTVGTVTDGDHASIINVGTDNDAVFNIVLPRGERGPQGDKGADGTSFTIKGLYATFSDLIAAHPTGSAGEAYAVGNSTSNVIYNWNVDTNAWDNIGSIQGPKGQDGQAATIQIGSVTQGTTASVVNTGTAQNAVLAFTLPKGDRGDDGKDGSDGKDGTQVSVDDLVAAGTLIATIYIDGVPFAIKAPITKIEALNDINDVTISNPLAGQILTYENGKWVNKTNQSANKIDFDDEHSILYLKNGNTVLDFTTIDSGAASIIHVQTHEESWWGNPNVTIEIVDSEEDITGGHFDENGDYFHKIHFLGEYTIIVTDEDGEQYTETFEDTQIGQVYYVFVEKMVDGETVLPTDDIQIWLRCASIKSEYTTLTQILQDTSLLNSLLQSENANKYLVRSTSWASDCGADEAFCTYLGLCDDVTVNKFLDDSTWCDAICNSAYFEKVLTIHVPTMTSNTTPSGEAFASTSYSGYHPYFAFNKVYTGDRNRWGAGTGKIANSYIGYAFPEAVRIRKVVIHNDVQVPAQGVKTFTLQGSSNNSTIDFETEVLTIEQSAVASYILNTSETDKYRYWRLLTKTNYGNTTTVSLHDIDFFGR